MGAVTILDTPRIREIRNGTKTVYYLVAVCILRSLSTIICVLCKGLESLDCWTAFQSQRQVKTSRLEVHAG